MNPRRGIKVTVFLFLLVLAVFAALTLLLPEPGQDATAGSGDGNGDASTGSSVNSLNEAQFRTWLGEARDNLSSVVSQIRAAGMQMSMNDTKTLDDLLFSQAGSYLGALDNMTVPQSMAQAQSEFRAALEDYRMAADYGAQGAEGMNMEKISQAMERFQSASSHSTKAAELAGVPA